MKSFVVLLMLVTIGVHEIAGQSCGAGIATFLFPDSGGARVIPDVRMNMLTVSRDQGWMNNPPAEWHELGKKETEVSQEILEALGTTTLGRPDRAWRIDEKIYENLLTQRRTFLADGPDEYLNESDKRAATFVEKEDGLPRIRTREGCGWMVAGKFEADGYETGYFVGHFTCGCTKQFVFRLKPLGSGSAASPKPAN